MLLKGKEPRVRARVRTQIGLSDEYIPEGRLGWLLATRSDGQSLVKWDRRAWPGSHATNELEVV